MNTKIENKLTPVRIIAFIFVALWLVIAMFPFIWTLWGSFKVQADFFSKADWSNAIFGFHTEKQTGSFFTMGGYYGSWIEEEFWRAVINTSIVVFFTV